MICSIKLVTVYSIPFLSFHPCYRPSGLLPIAGQHNQFCSTGATSQSAIPESGKQVVRAIRSSELIADCLRPFDDHHPHGNSVVPQEASEGQGIRYCVRPLHACERRAGGLAPLYYQAALVRPWNS